MEKEVIDFRNFWRFLKGDSWGATIVWLLIAFVAIKFIIFPLLSLMTGSVLPLVIVESCSMHHEGSFEDVLSNSIYSEHGISLVDAENWKFKNGLEKGDIIFVVGVDEPKVGDVIIFNAGQRNPLIHRIIENDDGKITTKGDNNNGLLPYEQGFEKEQIIGKAVGRVPWVGWVKLIFFDWRNSGAVRGIC